MMRKLVLLLIFTSVQSVFAQTDSSDLISKVFQNLKIDKSDCLTDLISIRKITNSESIMLIPEIADKTEDHLILNAHFVITDNQSGNINSQFLEKTFWYSDAMHLDFLEIVLEPKISEELFSFGVKAEYSNNSKADPYAINELTLFIRNKNKLIRVLKDYPVYTYSGETDGINSGKFTEHKKNIRPENTMTNLLFDLKVTDSVIQTISKEGKLISTDQTVTTENLKFRKGTYSVDFNPNSKKQY